VTGKGLRDWMHARDYTVAGLADELDMSERRVYYLRQSRKQIPKLVQLALRGLEAQVE
jgi:hypothetical protein